MKIEPSGVAMPIVVVGGYLYKPEPSYFEDEVAQQRLFDQTLGKDTLRRLDPFCQSALFAIEQARRACGSEQQTPDQTVTRHGIVVCTGFGAQTTRVRYARRLARTGPSATNPIDFPDSIDGAAAAHIAMRWGLNGPSLTFVDGRETAEAAVLVACRQIAFNRAERMYLLIGDIYEPWMKSQMGESLRSAQRPDDAVLALVLERFDASTHRNSDVRITGVLEHNVGELAAKESHFRAVKPPKEVALDLSGVQRIAGAWLEVTAPMGKRIRSCQDDAVDATCIEVGFGKDTRLAFWRGVASR